MKRAFTLCRDTKKRWHEKTRLHTLFVPLQTEMLQHHKLVSPTPQLHLNKLQHIRPVLRTRGRGTAPTGEGHTKS